jgi:AcrR family transcriptional regulator
MTRSGRRPGTPETRDHIVAVARRAFGAKGYDATSLRSIAAQAGVDPGLLVHYFGTKEGVFRAAVEVAVQPDQLFAGLEGLTSQDCAEQLVRRYLVVLAREETRDVVMGLIRSAVSNEHAADMLRDVLFQGLLVSLEHVIDGPDARLRASLIVAQLVGVAVLKYVVRVRVVMQATDDEIVALVSPAIERYLHWK